MSHWSYRIMHRHDGPNTWYELVEVYYDDNGQPNGFSQADAPHGNTPETIRRIMDDMHKALEQPVIQQEEVFRKSDKVRTLKERQALKKLGEDLK